MKTPTPWMSATKINTYAGSFGCPRKFYNQYIAKLPAKTSIYFPIGNIPHKTAEDIVGKQMLKGKSYEDAKMTTLTHHDFIWNQKKHEFDQFNVPDLDKIFQESRQMMLNWLEVYWAEDFIDPVPFVEHTLWDRQNMMMARVDRAYKAGPGIFHIVDYKTGKSNKIWDDTKLQLIIQWICYNATTGSNTHRVGAHFLRYPGSPEYWTPTQSEIDWALQKVEYVRSKTRSIDINDYPCTCGGRCQKDFIQNESRQNQTTASEDQAQIPKPE